MHENQVTDGYSRQCAQELRRKEEMAYPTKKFNFHSDLIKKGCACWGMHGSEWHEGPIILFFCYLLYSLTPDKSVLITAGNESFISDCDL